MDHEAYENQMIDGVNRNAEEKSKHVETGSSEHKATAKVIPLFTKRDSRILGIGFRRTILALLTAVAFAISVIGFIATAKAIGYFAVAYFFGSLMALGGAFILLYAQGLIGVES